MEMVWFLIVVKQKTSGISKKKLRRKKKPSRFWSLEILREIVTIDESFTNFFWNIVKQYKNQHCGFFPLWYSPYKEEACNVKEIYACNYNMVITSSDFHYWTQ